MAKGGSRQLPATRTMRRVTCGRVALVLALVMGITVAAAEPAPETPAAPAGKAGWDKTHDLGLGYRTLIFSTQMSDRYTLHGPTLAYTFFVGRRHGVLLRLEGTTLVAGHMSGPGGSFSGSLGPLYDQRHHGFDAMVLGARRTRLTDRVTVLAAAGLQLQGFSLNGTRYSPVEDVSIGLGALGQAGYTLNGWLSLSVQLTAGLHPFDLVNHSNPATWVVPLGTSFSIAARH